MLLAVSASAWAQGHGAAQGAPAKVSAAVTASDCWIRLIPSPAPSGGFFVAHNAGSEDAVLTGAHSPDYGMIMLHETTESGGMSKMSMVHKVAIPAGKDLAFKPGGYHIMFMNLKQPLKQGEMMKGTLTFEKAGSVDVEFKVDSIAAKGGEADHKGH